MTAPLVAMSHHSMHVHTVCARAGTTASLECRFPVPKAPMATLSACQLLHARGCAMQATTASARPTRSPLATRSVLLGSTALRAALTPAPRRVQLDGTAPGAAQRQIAPGLAMTARTCVASGVLAVQPQPQGVTHGLRVYPTRYCPAGSTSPEAVGCVSVSFYCASGSTAPTAVTIGYYSTPLDAAETARTGQAVCEKGYGAFHACWLVWQLPQLTACCMACVACWQLLLPWWHPHCLPCREVRQCNPAEFKWLHRRLQGWILRRW